MEDVLYQKLVKHWESVTDVPVQTVGPFTPIYKEVTKRLKVMPWIPMSFISIVSVICLYLVLGSTITLVVTILQRGF